MIDFNAAKLLAWPPPWASIKNEVACMEYARITADIFDHKGMIAARLEEELRREACPGHLLFGRECRAVAFNTEDPNEFVFLTSNPAMPLAWVHLTWQVETDPLWPYTVGYTTFEAFVEAMK
jgi:hypothetical protein